jgi:hypothetical protein
MVLAHKTDVRNTRMRFAEVTHKAGYNPWWISLRVLSDNYVCIEKILTTSVTNWIRSQVLKIKQIYLLRKILNNFFNEGVTWVAILFTQFLPCLPLNPPTTWKKKHFKTGFRMANYDNKINRMKQAMWLVIRVPLQDDVTEILSPPPRLHNVAHESSF